MFSSKKYLPIIAAFVVGVTGAVGYAVHAQSTGQTPNVVPNVQVGTATTGKVSDGDGETADDPKGVAQVQTSAQDPKQLDGEMADDATASVSATSSSQEAESGPADTGPDTGEVDTGN